MSGTLCAAADVGDSCGSRGLHAMVRSARFTGTDVHLGRADPVRALLLQALHQGTALRRYLHQHQEDLQVAAGLRVLTSTAEQPPARSRRVNLIRCTVLTMLGAFTLTGAALPQTSPYLSDFPKIYPAGYTKWGQSLPYALGTLPEWLTAFNRLLKKSNDGR